MDEPLVELTCCDCGGPLTVVDRKASILTAVCAECGNSHEIEIVIAPDETKTYWPLLRYTLKEKYSHDEPHPGQPAIVHSLGG